MIEAFFQALDQNWKLTGEKPVELHIFGSGALILQIDYERGTKDADILEINPIPKSVSEELKRLAGKNSELFKRHRLYLEIVPPGIPFLPPRPLFHPLTTVQDQLKNFQIHVMDPIDVAVSKLKTFRPADLDDIRAIIDADRLDAIKFMERFQLAKEQWLLGSRASELKQIVQNLHVIQRDYLLVDETPIELPHWLE